MKRLLLSSSLLLAFLAFLGCDTDPDAKVTLPTVVRFAGQTSFETPLGLYAGGFNGSAGSNTGAEPPLANDHQASEGSDADEGGAKGNVDRLIEESDLFKIEGDLLYLLNRYRGLQIIDLSDLDAPRLVGRAPIYGYPKEMYLRDGVAYVLVSDYWTYWRDEKAAEPALGGFYGSQLRLVDVRDPAHPEVIGALDLEGDCSDSRIVGDVLYLVSQRRAFWSNVQSSDAVNATSVFSVDLRSPGALSVVDEARFPSDAWAEQHLYADATAFILAAVSWSTSASGWGGGYETRLQYVDITDPEGHIAVRGSIAVEGRVQERWAMDLLEQAVPSASGAPSTAEPGRVLRVVSAQAWGNGDVYLTTIDASNPDALSRLGQATLRVNEQLKSARFDGERGYVVTYKNVDPLFAFDLSNPRAPKVLGELKMPGWLDFMVPMGDRIVALGRDEDSKLSVSLIDASGSAPTLIQRVSVGEGWGFVPSDADDYAKVFRVLPELGLIAFPFSHWDAATYRTKSGVQLVDLDLDADTLARRGLVESAGYVERGVVRGEATLLTLSSEVFQAVDVSNRDAPRVRSKLELARNVVDFALLDGDMAVQLSGDWSAGELKLTLTPRGDPDAVTPLGSLTLAAPGGRLFLNGNLAYVVHQQADSDTRQTRTAIQVVDLKNPARPQARGKLVLPASVHASYGRWYWGDGDEVARLGESALVFHRNVSRGEIWADGSSSGATDVGEAVPPSAPRMARKGGAQSERQLFFVDLSDPDAPRLASTVALPDSEWAWGLAVQGATVYLSDYTTAISQGFWVARYHLRPVDASDLNAPVVKPAISLPGWMVGLSDDGRALYTYESFWDSSSASMRQSLHTLSLDGDLARLEGSLALPSDASSVVVSGKRAFATRYVWDQRATAEGGSDGAVSSTSAPNASGGASSANSGLGWRSGSELLSIDLSNPSAPAVAGRVRIPGNGYGWIRKALGNRVFVSGDSGLFAFELDDAHQLSFERFIRTQGWVQDIAIDGTTAFLPSGVYGVQVVEL